MAIGMGVGLGPVHIVLDGDTAPLAKTGRGKSPPPKKNRPIFIVAKWLDASTKMPLGTEVGLCVRDIVFDVDSATPRKRARPP